jgi:GxxExxY protein
VPYEDEEPPYVERPRLEPDPALDDLTAAVIGAAIEVHRQLGPGLDEALYKAGMCVEMRLRNIPFACEVTVPVFYKGEQIGKKRIDLVVGERIVVELKAVECLTALHKAQLHTYLKIMNYRLGLLINFNCPVLKDGIKRVINPTAS